MIGLLKEILLNSLYLVSKVVNVLTGGNFGEYYCSRVYRRGWINQILLLNWVFFTLNSNETNHCKRVYENDSKV
jgi:hypothetical protein